MERDQSPPRKAEKSQQFRKEKEWFAANYQKPRGVLHEVATRDLSSFSRLIWESPTRHMLPEYDINVDLSAMPNLPITVGESKWNSIPYINAERASFLPMYILLRLKAERQIWRCQTCYKRVLDFVLKYGLWVAEKDVGPYSTMT